MTSQPLPYPRRALVSLAGTLALVALLTAALYEWRSTPYTMVVFLLGGASLLLTAVILFGWALWKDLRARLQSITSRAFSVGQIIYRQGDPAEHIFIITQGRVEVVHTNAAGNEVKLGDLGVDDHFGETAILSSMPRQATARALTAVEVLAIHRTDFLRLYDSLPRLRARIDRAHGARRGVLPH